MNPGNKITGIFGQFFRKNKSLNNLFLSVLYLLSVNTENVLCQKEYNTWHLEIDDTYNSISFNSPDGNIVLIKDNFFDLFNLSNSSTISDSTGQPFFSTNGYHYWNQLKEKISISDTNCSLADGPLDWGVTSFTFKVPGNTKQYYIITPWTGCGSTLSSNGLRYSLVDFSFNPSGDVIYKNKMLNEYINSDLGVTYHANKRDVWIVVKDSSKNIFRSYLAKDNGIKLTNTSKINISSDNYIEIGSNWNLGNLKLANQGDILAFCHFGMNPGNYIKEGKLILSKFNNITGAISNPIEIDKSLIGFPVSVEISPNSRYIYVTTCDTSWSASPGNITKKISSIYQLDVSVWDSMTIANSITPLYKAISSNDRDRPDTLLGQLQLGPNGKIYLLEQIWIGNNQYTYHISSINRPNQKGSSSNFLKNINFFGTSNHMTGLPKSLFKSLLKVSVRGDTVCEGDLLKVTSSVESEVDGYKYFWLGPNGFSSTDSNLIFLKAIPSMTGWYKLKVTLNDLEESDSVFVKVYSKPNIRFEPNNHVHFCQGDSTTIKAVSDSLIITYKWSTGAKTQGLTVKNGGYYSVAVSDINGCFNKDSILVIVESLPRVKIVPEGAINFCLGDSVVLKATPDSLDFVWSTGDKAKSIIVKQTGKYSIIGTNSTGCRGYDTIEVTVSSNLKPKIIFEGDDPACDGDSINLSSSLTGSGYDYTWSNGETSESIIVSQSGIYTLKVSTGGSCEGMDSIYVSINPNPLVKILGSSSICNGESSVLSSDNDYPSYLWSTGENTKSIIIKNAGQYWLEAKNEFGCTARDTIEVTEIETKLEIPDALTFDSLCFGGSQARDIEITNAVNSVITIDDISISGAGFRLDKPFQPFILDSGATLPIKLLFIPETPGNNIGELIIYSASPCALRDTVQLNAYSMPVIQVRAGEASGYPGDKSCIPVYGRLIGNSPEPMGLDYSLSMAFPLKSFMPESPDEGIISGDKRIVNLSGSGIFTSQETSLGEVCGRIMLYPDSIVAVNINAFYADEYVTCNDLEPGMIRIFPVCAEGTRLIELIDKPVLIISPNPVRDELNFSIKGSGETPSSYIIRDMLGREASSELIKSNSIDISPLSTGIYMIQFSFRDGAILNYRFMKE